MESTLEEETCYLEINTRDKAHPCPLNFEEIAEAQDEFPHLVSALKDEKQRLCYFKVKIGEVDIYKYHEYKLPDKAKVHIPKVLQL